MPRRTRNAFPDDRDGSPLLEGIEFGVERALRMTSRPPRNAEVDQLEIDGHVFRASASNVFDFPDDVGDGMGDDDTEVAASEVHVGLDPSQAVHEDVGGIAAGHDDNVTEPDEDPDAQQIDDALVDGRVAREEDQDEMNVAEEVVQQAENNAAMQEALQEEEEEEEGEDQAVVELPARVANPVNNHGVRNNAPIRHNAVPAQVPRRRRVLRFAPTEKPLDPIAFDVLKLLGFSYAHRNNIQGITKAAIRKLARKGGCKRISALVYEEVRGVLKVFLQNILKDTVCYTCHA